MNLIQSPLNYCSCLSEIILMTVTSVLGSESRDQMEEERVKIFHLQKQIGQTLEIFGLYWAWFYLFHALGDHFIYSSATVFLILNNHHVRINYLSKCDKLWTLWISTIIMFVIIMVTMRTTQKIVYTPLFLRLPSNMSFYLHSTKEINWRKCIQWSEKKHLKKKSIYIYDFFLNLSKEE